MELRSGTLSTNNALEIHSKSTARREMVETVHIGFLPSPVRLGTGNAAESQAGKECQRESVREMVQSAY